MSYNDMYTKAYSDLFMKPGGVIIVGPMLAPMPDKERVFILQCLQNKVITKKQAKEMLFRNV